MIFKESRNKSFISANSSIKPLLSKDLNKTGKSKLKPLAAIKVAHPPLACFKP